MIGKSTKVVPCQWVGAEQDPRKGPLVFCNHASVPGKSYCPEHYPRVYVVGSALTKGRSAGGRSENTTIVEELQEAYEELVEEGEILVDN